MAIEIVKLVLTNIGFTFTLMSRPGPLVNPLRKQFYVNGSVSFMQQRQRSPEVILSDEHINPLHIEEDAVKPRLM